MKLFCIGITIFVFSITSFPGHGADAENPAGGLRDVTDESGLVGICYSTWFNPVVKDGQPIYNISEILAAADSTESAPVAYKWGPLQSFHYWGQPALGYYRSDDTAVIECHMDMLAAASVDFIILDNTNMHPNWPPDYKRDMVYTPYAALLDTIGRLRAAGRRAPHVVIWCPSSVAADMFERFYARPEYRQHFLYWNDAGRGLKPLLLTTDGPDPDLTGRFTVRKMWGLQPRLASQEWSFLQPHPQQVALSGGAPEQISVSVAHQQTYMSEPTAVGRRGGRTFQEQWRRAFDVRPKFITITWWNEWIAQRFEFEGRTAFVDNYTREFSRDIEPMVGGHGAAYYEFMKAYIAAYKQRQPFPEILLESAHPPRQMTNDH